MTLKCPKCEDDLGCINGEYHCWNVNCGFRSHRPWINPPRIKQKTSLSSHESQVIGECLRAAAVGPFFIDKGNKENPYWEYQTLFGFEPKEVEGISGQWPDVDAYDEFISELVGLCLQWLLSYPHDCEREWESYISVSREELANILASWESKMKNASNKRL